MKPAGPSPSCMTRSSWAASSWSAAPRPTIFATAAPASSPSRMSNARRTAHPPHPDPGNIPQKGPPGDRRAFFMMYFITGPTACGKSEIAVEVAARCDAEIIGADAFQVYEGLERLSAWPEPELRAMIPHHLIGAIPISEKFDVARYRELALAKAEEIARRGKHVLIVGGTGLYIRALT